MTKTPKTIISTEEESYMEELQRSSSFQISIIDDQMLEIMELKQLLELAWHTRESKDKTIVYLKMKVYKLEHK